MPRTCRPNRFLELQCAMCSGLFKAVREDAQTCGPVCRQQLSRAKRAVRAGLDGTHALKADGRTVCGECGTTRDGRTKQCPVCRSTRKKDATR